MTDIWRNSDDENEYSEMNVCNRKDVGSIYVHGKVCKYFQKYLIERLIHIVGSLESGCL